MAAEAVTAARAAALTCVAVYRRTIHASLARIWENVLDWEHLPWLHRTSFRAIRLLDADHTGWRARVTLAAETSYEIGLDVQLDRPNLRYVSRTVEGRGAGSEILTRLDPIDPRTTGITVEFRLPDVPAAHAESIGAAYVRLYAQLWDEDEAMMVRRQTVLDGPRASHPMTTPLGRLPLGDAASVATRAPFVVEMNGGDFRIVAIDGQLLTHAVVCPHRGGPLDHTPVVDNCITCPWHGYRFDIRSGGSRDGRGYRLDPAPHVEIDPQSSQAFLVRSQ